MDRDQDLDDKLPPVQTTAASTSAKTDFLKAVAPRALPRNDLAQVSEAVPPVGDVSPDQVKRALIDAELKRQETAQFPSPTPKGFTYQQAQAQRSGIEAGRQQGFQEGFMTGTAILTSLIVTIWLGKTIWDWARGPTSQSSIKNV